MLLLLLLFDVVYKRRLPSVAAGEIYVRNDESYFAVYQSLIEHVRAWCTASYIHTKLYLSSLYIIVVILIKM